MFIETDEERKAKVLAFFDRQMQERSWSYEFKSGQPVGVEDELIRVTTPESKLIILFHLSSEFLIDDVNGWERRIETAVEKAESLFMENTDRANSIKLKLKSDLSLSIEPVGP